MKALIIGSGGREHAIAKKISESPQNPELIFAPGNPGMAGLGKCFDIPATDKKALIQIAKDEKVDITIVGPEAPLVDGVVDDFENEGLKIFGPSAAASRLEGSKSFSKDFMAKYNIPTATYKNFTELNPALDYLQEMGAPIVVKASGLAAGKGAIVCLTLDEAHQAVQSMLGENPQFGEAGKQVVIEEFMQGEEASLFAFCDGKNFVLLPSAQDHKRAFDNDQGPNTGGMGAYSPAPIMTSDLILQAEKEIIQPTLEGMAQEGCPYVGVLYVGLMITKLGPKVVEYNCRLGDPEAQVVLPIMDGDLLDIINACLEKKASSLPSPPTKKHAAIVILAAPGYPGSYPKGIEIMGIHSELPEGVHVIHAGTTIKEGKLFTSGGRVLGLVGEADSLESAIQNSYLGIERVTFENAHFRKDIGQKGLARIGVITT